MPTFKYRVRDRSGKAVEGTIEAPTLQLAGDQLHHLGYLPIVIEEVKEAVSLNLSDLWSRFQKVRLEEIVLFSQQFSTLYKAGVPLLSGLFGLKEQTENKKLKQVLEQMHSEIEGGSTLFTAMSRHPRVFPNVYTNMIRAGETSGRLGESLDRFITLAEREIRTRQRVREATRYPKIVTLALVIAFGVLIYFVIPRFAMTFAQFKTPLPLPTRIMIRINEIFHTYWYLVMIGVFGIPVALKRSVKTEKGKQMWDKIKGRIPVFGSLFLKIALSKFAYTFVMLYKSGIPILPTLEITSTTVDNSLLSQSIGGIQQKVREGKGLADALRESGQFTPLVIQMVSVGESSGSLDEMLMRVSEYYDLEVDNQIKKLSAYLEPMLTVLMGVVVLFLALAVFLPWWNMASLFR